MTVPPYFNISWLLTPALHRGNSRSLAELCLDHPSLYAVTLCTLFCNWPHIWIPACSFSGGNPPSLNAPSLNHACLCLLALVSFPNLLKPAAGRFQPGFYCKAAGVFSSSRQASPFRSTGIYVPQQAERAHTWRHAGDTLDSCFKFESCHWRIENIKLRRLYVDAHQAIPGNEVCRGDTDNCINVLISCLFLLAKEKTFSF